LNYNHLYHAGNFADIFKHLTLIFCLEKLREKDTPFFVLDTHAGSGKYDLTTTESLKTNEASEGIQHFIKSHYSSDNILKTYLEIIARINFKNAEKNNDEQIKFYPGSPYIIKSLLRPQDRAIFCEIKHQEFFRLKNNFAGAKNIFYLNEDGFELTKSKLPPIEKRGLILIDPAFEKISDPISRDYEKTVEAVKNAIKRFSHGIYLVWHPIIDKESEQKTLQDFYQKMANLQAEKMLHLIFDSNKKDSIAKMKSCGMFIINAPWGLEEKLRIIFKDNIK